MTFPDLSELDPRDPYLIAEIGVNHFDIAEQRSITPLEAAKRMVAAAAEAGVDAVKFQSYSAESLATTNSPAYWDSSEEETETQYELFTQYDDFGAAEFREIAEWTDANHDVDFLSTPFNGEAVEYLSDLVPAYKIASADITNHPLLRQVATKGKPILLSTGASTIAEIDAALRVIEAEASETSVCLLHCVLDYPTEPTDANLRMIEHLADVYPEHPPGYSDHVPPDDGMITLLNAAVRGAAVIEKHFTLDKTLPGNDHYHAMAPEDVETYRQNLAMFRLTAGQRRKEPMACEEDSRTHARRSIVAAQDIDAGEDIERDKISIKRPGTGISPQHLDLVLGRTARRPVSDDEILTWDHL